MAQENPHVASAIGAVQTHPQGSSRSDQRQALDDLFSLTYEELRRLAACVRRGDPSATLSPTVLVNEAWLKLANSPELGSSSPLHFKRIAARAMRGGENLDTRDRLAASLPPGAECYHSGAGGTTAKKDTAKKEISWQKEARFCATQTRAPVC